MSDSSIFFSYSRDDSEFVLNLARNLRKSGATIWLDQLDIKPGSRWDSAIEKGLDASDTLLVILSCSSVTSNNVLDEVSYALEENKRVVPVLLEECDIPFRLRRLQYADFTQDPKTGIATLIKALHLDDSVALKLADVAIDDPSEAKKIKQETILKAKKPSEENKRTEPKKIIPPIPPSKPVHATTKKSTGSTSLLYIIGGIVVGGGLVVFLLLALIAAFGDENYSDTDIATDPGTYQPNELNTIPTNDGNAETTAWQTALNSNTLDGFFTYLYAYGKTAPHYTATYQYINQFLPNTAYVHYGIQGIERYYDKHLYYFGDELSLPQVDDIITPRSYNVLYSNTRFSPKGIDIQPGRKLLVRSVYVDENSNVWAEVGFQ